MKECDHLLHSLRHHQRMNFTRGFKDIRPRLGHPVVLQVTPLSLQDMAVDRTRVTVARKNPCSLDSKQIHIVSSAGTETERSKGDGISLRHPQHFVGHALRKNLLNKYFAEGFGRLSPPIWLVSRTFEVRCRLFHRRGR